MPAPKILAGLPKPLLFGLYGAVGGFTGALLVAEPLILLMLSGDGKAKGLGLAFFLLLTTAFWTAAIVTPICLALLAGQHHYLRGSLPDAKGFGVGVLGGIAVGMLGGGAGQMLYFLAPNSLALNVIIRIFAWGLLGGLAGLGLSLFIPNMKRLLGLAGGTIGGGAGCILFIVASIVMGETVGRIVGGLVLGFCIGVMVAVAETAFRSAWLEVLYGGGEKITVSLGPEPVKLGGDSKSCTVWARGAAPLAMRFFIRDGVVICDDRVEECETAAADGFTREIGNVTVTVRMSGTAAPTSHRRRPVARPISKPSATSFDDDDGFDLPMSLSPSPPPTTIPPPLPAAASYDEDEGFDFSAPVSPSPPPAPIPPAARAQVPVSVSSIPTPATPQAVPVEATLPVKPAIKDPDACPWCGRMIPGRVGKRYCMVCDQTY